MSIHRSLVSKSSLGRSRNVLTRYERILEMRKIGSWDEEEGRPYGLPKVKVVKIKKRIKKREDDPRKGGPPQGKRQSGKQDQTSADSGRTSAEGTSAREPTRPKFGGFSHLDIRLTWWPIPACCLVALFLWALFF